MKAMLIEENKLVLRDIPEPVLKPGYVIIDIHAAALNRADLLQVAGKYPPPPGWPCWWSSCGPPTRCPPTSLPTWSWSPDGTSTPPA